MFVLRSCSISSVGLSSVWFRTFSFLTACFIMCCVAGSASAIPQHRNASPSALLSVAGGVGRPLGAAGFVYPLLGTRVSSDFGTRRHPVRGVTRHHDGIDLAAPHGAAVRAIADGVVGFADPRGGYGNLVVIFHADGHSSHYGHLQSIAVKPGTRIKAGEILGRVGSTGISTGPHLHFEIRFQGRSLDPETILPGLAALGDG